MKTWKLYDLQGSMIYLQVLVLNLILMSFHLYKLRLHFIWYLQKHVNNHLTKSTAKQLKNEIERSNKIFLKELGEIPTLFAHPYGETNEIVIDLLKDYKFKFAFGQHSGVINETSN